MNGFGQSTWEGFSKETQRIYQKALELDEHERQEALKDIAKVFKAQFKLIHNLEDERYLELEELAEKNKVSYLDKIEAHIQPDIEKNPNKLMKASEIVKYLITASKGLINEYDKTNLHPQLEKRGFEWVKEGRTRKYFVDVVHE